MVYIIQNRLWEIAINTFKKIYLHRRPSYTQVGILLYCHVQS